MARNFIQQGEAIDVAAPYDTTSGGGCQIGKLFGIAQSPEAAGDNVVVVTVGVWSVAKVSAQAWTVGADIYWDDTAKLFTTTAGSNLKVGHALVAASNPSSTGVVRLRRAVG